MIMSARLLGNAWADLGLPSLSGFGPPASGKGFLACSVPFGECPSVTSPDFIHIQRDPTLGILRGHVVSSGIPVDHDCACAARASRWRVAASASASRTDSPPGDTPTRRPSDCTLCPHSIRVTRYPTSQRPS